MSVCVCASAEPLSRANPNIPPWLYLLALTPRFPVHNFTVISETDGLEDNIFYIKIK